MEEGYWTNVTGPSATLHLTDFFYDFFFNPRWCRCVSTCTNRKSGEISLWIHAIGTSGEWVTDFRVITWGTTYSSTAWHLHVQLENSHLISDTKKLLSKLSWGGGGGWGGAFKWYDSNPDSSKSWKSHLLEREVTERISHIRPSQKFIFETEN